MPDEELMRRFEAIVQSAQEPLVRRYLEEAHRCFTAEAYNGAVVMAWNAASWYLRRVVEAVSFPLFQCGFRLVIKGIDQPDDLQKVIDSHLIKSCQGMGILNDNMAGKLNRLREKRNDCAHPSGIFISAEAALAVIENIAEIVDEQTEGTRIINIGALLKFVETASKEEAAKIGHWVQENLGGPLADRLLDKYLLDEEIENPSGIVGLWQGLWPRLDEQQREQLWGRLEEAVQEVLGDEQSLRTPEDIVRLIVWPSPDEDREARDRIGELFIEWFQGLAQSGDFRAVDMDLAREVRRHLPVPLRERLQATLEEMIRRYTE